MRPLLLLLFILLGASAFSQKKEKLRRARINYAQHTIQQLASDGAILIRLRTGKGSLAALEVQGRLKKKAKYEQYLWKQHYDLVSAFTKHFHFCPVYFYYSDQSALVAAGRLGEVVFLDTALQETKHFTFPHAFYLNADLGYIQEDTMQYWQHDYRFREGSRMFTTSNNGFPAFVLSDSRYRQLDSPFPYYVRSWESLGSLRRNKVRIATRLDEKMVSYLEEAKIKLARKKHRAERKAARLEKRTKRKAKRVKRRAEKKAKKAKKKADKRVKWAKKQGDKGGKKKAD